MARHGYRNNLIALKPLKKSKFRHLSKIIIALFVIEHLLLLTHIYVNR